jgi:excisionase family DNA binding protein
MALGKGDYKRTGATQALAPRNDTYGYAIVPTLDGLKSPIGWVVTSRREVGVAIERPCRSPAPCLVDTIRGRARRLGVSEVTVRRRIKSGDILAARIGGAWRLLAPERGSPDQLSEVCSVRQVANSLDVSDLTVRRLIRSGRLKAFKDGRHWLIPRDGLSALLAEPIRGMGISSRPRVVGVPTSHGSLDPLLSGPSHLSPVKYQIPQW